MKKNQSILFAAFLLLVTFTSFRAEAAVNRIILIGNSITLGKKSSDNRGFRDELYYRLQGMGYPFEFVGDTGNNPFKGHFKAAAFVGDFYYGRGGNGSFNCNYAMDNFNPTIAVIHLGSNDFWLDEPPAPYTDNGGLTFTKKIAGKLAHLVDALLRWHDGSRGQHLQTIFICKIIPKSWRHAQGIQEFNAEVGRFVEDVHQGRVPKIPPGIVKLVDQYSTFDPKTMLDSDGTHPNKAGYRHMSIVFANAFKTLPLYLKQVAGDNQTALPNTVLSQPLSVRITNGYDENSPYVPVRFQVIRGDAQLLSPALMETDTSGMASVEVQLGYSQETQIRVTASGLIDSTTVFSLKTRKHLQAEGQVTYYNGLQPVPSVDLMWQEKVIKMGSTDDAGIFQLDSLPKQEPVTLKPQKQPISYTFGSTILSYDAALIARHVVGLDSLSDRQKDAADVDKDSTITMLDAVHVARYAVGSGWSDEQETMNKANDIQLQMFQIQRSDTIIVKMQIHGLDLLSCDLELEFLRNKMVFLRALKTETSQRFNLSRTMVSKGIIRIGLFGPSPVPESADFLEIQFIQKEAGENLSLLIKKAIVNNIHLHPSAITTRTTGGGLVPQKMALGSNYPNPFNSETVIPFHLPNRTKIELNVYNIVGEKVRQLANSFFGPGNHHVRWDGCDGKGRSLPSGIYFARLAGQGKYHVQKIELIR